MQEFLTLRKEIAEKKETKMEEDGEEKEEEEALERLNTSSFSKIIGSLSSSGAQKKDHEGNAR